MLAALAEGVGIHKHHLQPIWYRGFPKSSDR